MTILSVVIPAYNEEGGIADIAQRVLAVGPSLAQAGVAELELLVDRISGLVAKQRAARNERAIAALGNAIATMQHAIDSVVAQSYRLTSDELALISGDEAMATNH